MLKKGYFIWQLEQCAPNINTLMERLSSAGVQYVVIKVADGEAAYPRTARNQHFLTETILQFRARGIEVWGWSMIYGQHGIPVRDIPAEVQADTFAEQIRIYGLSAAVIEAENFGGMRWNAPRATAFMQHLRGRLQEMGLGNMCLILSSYRFPTLHADFPIRQFMAGCDAAMPQVYWIQSDPVADLQRSVNEYKIISEGKPVIPAGIAAPDARGLWRPTVAQINRFMGAADAMELDRVNFWSWQHAFAAPEIWQAIAAYGTTGQINPDTNTLPIQTLQASGVIKADEVNYRSLPSARGNVPIGQFYQGDEVRVTGQVITSEDPAIWYRVRINQQEYWVAARYVDLLPETSSVGP